MHLTPYQVQAANLALLDHLFLDGTLTLHAELGPSGEQQVKLVARVAGIGLTLGREPVPEPVVLQAINP